MIRKIWTTEEIQFILTNYEEKGAKFCSENLSRSIDSVKHRARKLELRSSKAASNRKWKEEEDKIIKGLYPENGAIPCLPLLPGRTRDAIVLRAGHLGIRMTRQHNKWDHKKYEEELFLREIDYYPREEYINANTPIVHECLNEHMWRAAPSHVLGGTNCPYCEGTYGFKLSSPAILYYIKISKEQKVYYKIGITNRTVQDRFPRSIKYITILQELKFNKGKEALVAEQRLLELYKEKRVTIHNLLVESGNTELFIEDVLNLDK